MHPETSRHNSSCFSIQAVATVAAVCLFLFAGSVGSNISLQDPRVTPEQVRLAARAVRAHRFIEALPQGYDEEVRERGSNFSVGEKQLLSFARALAFDPAVLVLDEATASVDPETERRIQEALDCTMRGRTAVVIAHRLATVQDVHRILSPMGRFSRGARPSLPYPSLPVTRHFGQGSIP